MKDVPAFVQTDAKAFVRDTRNHALLNTDQVALLRHRAARLKTLTQAHRIDTLEADVAQLKSIIRSWTEGR